MGALFFMSVVFQRRIISLRKLCICACHLEIVRHLELDLEVPREVLVIETDMSSASTSSGASETARVRSVCKTCCKKKNNFYKGAACAEERDIIFTRFSATDSSLNGCLLHNKCID